MVGYSVTSNWSQHKGSLDQAVSIVNVSGEAREEGPNSTILLCRPEGGGPCELYVTFTLNSVQVTAVRALTTARTLELYAQSWAASEAEYVCTIKGSPLLPRHPSRPSAQDPKPQLALPHGEEYPFLVSQVPNAEPGSEPHIVSDSGNLEGRGPVSKEEPEIEPEPEAKPETELRVEHDAIHQSNGEREALLSRLKQSSEAQHFSTPVTGRPEEECRNMNSESHLDRVPGDQRNPEPEPDHESESRPGPEFEPEPDPVPGAEPEPMLKYDIGPGSEAVDQFESHQLPAPQVESANARVTTVDHSTEVEQPSSEEIIVPRISEEHPPIASSVAVHSLPRGIHPTVPPGMFVASLQMSQQPPWSTLTIRLLSLADKSQAQISTIQIHLEPGVAIPPSQRLGFGGQGPEKPLALPPPPPDMMAALLQSMGGGGAVGGEAFLNPSVLSAVGAGVQGQGRGMPAGLMAALGSAMGSPSVGQKQSFPGRLSGLLGMGGGMPNLGGGRGGGRGGDGFELPISAPASDSKREGRDPRVKGPRNRWVGGGVWADRQSRDHLFEDREFGE